MSGAVVPATPGTVTKRGGREILVLDANAIDHGAIVALFQSDPDWTKVDLELANGDPEQAAKRIMEEKSRATTAEGIFGSSVASTKDSEGKVFRLDAVEYQPADPKYRQNPDALPFYAVLKGVDGNGEVVVLTSGSKRTVFEASLAASKGLLPHWVKVVGVDVEGGRAIALQSAAKSERPFDETDETASATA